MPTLGIFFPTYQLSHCMRAISQSINGRVQGGLMKNSSQFIHIRCQTYYIRLFQPLHSDLECISDLGSKLKSLRSCGMGHFGWSPRYLVLVKSLLMVSCVITFFFFVMISWCIIYRYSISPWRVCSISSACRSTCRPNMPHIHRCYKTTTTSYPAWNRTNNQLSRPISSY